MAAAAPLAALGVIWVFHAAATLAWLARNSLPDGLRDEFLHSQRAVELFFRARDLGGEGLHYWLFEGYYPPLVPLVGDLFLVLGPNHEDTLAASNLLWLALLIGATFAIGRRLYGPWTGVLAAALVCLYPSIHGNARHLEPNVALAAASACAVWALLASDGFRRLGPSLGFGAALAAGLLVDRVAMAPLMAGPAVAALIAGWRGSSTRGPLLRNAGLALGLTVLLAGYYYVQFMGEYLAEMTAQVGGEVDAYGTRTAAPSPLSPLYWTYYLLVWFDAQMGLALGLAALAGLAVALRRPRGQAWPLLVWLLAGTALFTLLGKKQPYYTLPLLPAAAVLTAHAITAIRLRGAAAALATVLLLAGLHQWSALSWDRPWLPTAGPLRILAGQSPIPEDWMGNRFQQSRPPTDHGLRFDDAIAAIRGAGFDPGTDRIAVFADGTAFYESYLVSMTRLHLDTLAVEGVLIFPQAVTEHAPQTGWFLYATRDLDRAWPTEHEIARTHAEFYTWEGNPPLVEAVEAMGRRAQLLASFTVASGGMIHAYRLESTP